MTKDLLVAAGVGVFGTTADFSIHVGAFPVSPEACILINAVGGLPPHPRLSLNYPSVQIVVRGKASGYVAASAKIQQCVAVLLGMATQTLSGDIYRACNLMGDVFTLGQDDNARPLLGANLRYIVEPALVAGGHRVSIS